MSQEFSVSEDVKQYVSEILNKYNFDPASKIEYKRGSEVGEGYASQNVMVDIKDNDKSLNLFLKCSGIAKREGEFGEIFKIETFFYDVLHPAFVNFQKKHNVEDVFDNVPKFYGYSNKGSEEIIALENLKSNGYALFDRFALYNDDHMTLILQTMAKFHAVSYAFKDQERETYDSWRGNLFDFSKITQIDIVDLMGNQMMQELISKFDPVEDLDILMAFSNMGDVMKSAFQNLKTDHAIITKGDCWNNNMLFLYEGDDRDKPIDMMLIDWAAMKEAPAVHDLFVIIYPMATQEMLDNIDHYLKVYHDELSSKIRELGSDPEKLCSYSAFIKEWDDSAPLAFGYCASMLRIIIAREGETMNMDEMIEGKVDRVFPKFKDESAYLTRLKRIARHIINRLQIKTA